MTFLSSSLYAQPTSPVSIGDVRVEKIGATFPRISEPLRNLCGAISWILGEIRPLPAQVSSCLFSISVCDTETRFEAD